MSTSDQTRRPFWIWVWFFFLCGHLAGAFLWWWMMPHGFPPTHSRFWVNQVLALVVATAAFVGLVARLRRKNTVSDIVTVSFVVFWTSAAITGFLVFPDSLLRLRWLVPIGLLVANLWLAIISSIRRHQLGIRFFAAPLIFGALSAGAVVTQRALPPSTSPLNLAVPNVIESFPGESDDVHAQIAPHVRFQTSSGTVLVSHNNVTLTIQPLLTFISKSADRFWTNFASSADREGAHRRFLSVLGNKPQNQHIVQAAYVDDGEHFLQVQARDRTVLVTSYCSLEDEIYSHLNSFCDMTISGHENASLAFSPCPSEMISIEPASYPVGRPMRLAYIDHTSRFNVVEANSGEKGPFHSLAEGELPTSTPLSITILDHDTPVFRVSFDDWAAQASTELSPTAGWGLPMNAIEFARSGDDLTSPCAIWMTLAGTSVGRGWDSVGHRDGVYRNRMRIELLDR